MTDVVTQVQDVVVEVAQPIVPPSALPPKIGLVEIHLPGQAGGAGASQVFIGDTPPANAVPGDQFWESDTGQYFIYYDDGNSKQWVQIAPGKGNESANLNTAGGLTVDTGELYRIIMLSDGSVHAIPYNAVPPTVPTGLAAAVRLTSVNLTWTASTGAMSYVIKRDGVQIGTTSNLSYRDINVIISTSYVYTVSAVDQYQQRSPPSNSVSVYIDPALNAAPTDVVIKVWPNPIPTDGPAYVRVNAREIDVQTIAFTLGVDVGSLTATADPSVWTLTI